MNTKKWLSRFFAVLLALAMLVPSLPGAVPLAWAYDFVPPEEGIMMVPNRITYPDSRLYYFDVPIIGRITDGLGKRVVGTLPGAILKESSSNPERNTYFLEISIPLETPPGEYTLSVVFHYMCEDITDDGRVYTARWDTTVSNYFKIFVRSDAERYIHVEPRYVNEMQRWHYDVTTQLLNNIYSADNITLNDAPPGVHLAYFNVIDGSGMLDFFINSFQAPPGVHPVSITYTDSITGESVKSNEFNIVIPGNEGPPVNMDGDQFSKGYIRYEVTNAVQHKVKAVGFNDNPIPPAFDLVIPNGVFYNGEYYAVTAIGEDAFHYHGAKSVTISEGIQTIGNFAFFQGFVCTSVTIPASVTNIGQGVFNNSSSLTSLTVHPDNYWYESVDNVLYSKWDRYLLCYPGGKPGESYTVPGTVKEIWAYAFTGNDYIKTLILPEGLSRIWEQGLGSRSLKTVRLPASLQRIATGLYGTFFNAYSLDNLTVAEDSPYFKAVDSVLFDKQSGDLIAYTEGKPGEHYDIPEGTKHLGNGSFIRQAIVPGNLKSVTLPESLTSVSASVFRFQTNLVSVNIPESLTAIGINMFVACRALPAITLHPGVTDVGAYAFSGCESLALVRSEAITAPALGANAFIDINKNAVLYIPSGSSESYAAAGWPLYFSEVRYLGSGGLPATPPAITTDSLPDGTVGTAYDKTLTATGETAITWSLDSGGLPDGLTLSAAGVISGTPIVGGRFNFTVKATNSAGSDTRAFSAVINPAGGAAVNAPVVSGAPTANSITVSTTAPTNGQVAEYARNTTNTAPVTGWQDSGVFGGLGEDTLYYFFARSKANGSYNTGAASSGTAIRTAGAAKPEIKRITVHENSVTVDLVRPQTGSAVLIIAIFDIRDYMLVMKTQVIEESGENTLTGIDTSIAEGKILRAMMWDGSGAMIPLCRDKAVVKVDGTFV